MKISVQNKKNKNELSVQTIVKDLIDKHQSKLPLFTDHITIKFNIVPHSHPVLTLNTFHLRSQIPKVAILRVLIHEQLHWFYSNRFNTRLFSYFKNKYIDTKVDEDGDLITNTKMMDVETKDPKTGKIKITPTEVANDDRDLAVNPYKIPILLGNPHATIEHIAVIWNELNIINPQGRSNKDKLITKREYDWLYFKYKDVYPNGAYMALTYWLLKNFKEVEYDLSRFNLLWTPKDNKIVKYNINTDTNTLSMDQLNNLNGS